ncbi:hypothetical protein C8N24_3599 [Solirubrobacter pauli]|uniref:Lipoprotein LprG n=1 Tax=Solirubrobacter pauli TaxID=166793 RepID=A0A660LF36_9ACTN|nr:hypothetical protein [Solirubrobacter pauli]RKQ93728.1 hypothetical protein C8N24_3599 [Solirubrobacter pauli]
MRFLGVLLATALVLAGCGADGSERASATSDARQLLSATVNNLPELRSATLDAKIDAAADGRATQVALRGPFQAGKKGETPRFALSAELTSEGRKESAGVAYTGKAAYVTLKGASYEVPSMLAGQLTAGLEQALAQGGTGGPLTTIDLKRWVPTPVNAGTADVGGVQTVKLTGPADVKKVISDINLLTGQLSSLQGVPGVGGKVPKQIPADAGEKIKDLTVTVFTGAEDQILRRLVVEGTATSGDAHAVLDLTLTKVGEDQSIEAPKNVRPFAELLGQLQGAGILGG